MKMSYMLYIVKYCLYQKLSESKVPLKLKMNAIVFLMEPQRFH